MFLVAADTYVALLLLVVLGARVAGDAATVGMAMGMLEVRVDPATMTVHEARDAARALRAAHPGAKTATIVVSFEPGLHHVGNTALVLGPEDANTHWRSADEGHPALMGAPIKVTGWKAHPSVAGALVAPLPSNVTKGSTLRQLWVNGARAERPRIHGHGLQQASERQLVQPQRSPVGVLCGPSVRPSVRPSVPSLKSVVRVCVRACVSILKSRGICACACLPSPLQRACVRAYSMQCVVHPARIHLVHK